MLNLFPIQWLALLAYFILRLITGGVLLYLGSRHWRHRLELRAALPVAFFPTGNLLIGVLILTEIVSGILLALGLYTQIAALAIISLAVIMILFHKYFAPATVPNRTFYILLSGVGISLLITGAGAFAFDLPI